MSGQNPNEPSSAMLQRLSDMRAFSEATGTPLGELDAGMFGTMPNAGETNFLGMSQGTMSGLGTVIDGLSALGGLYMANKQLGLAKDSLNFQKDAFNKNYTAQKNSFNEANEYRQRIRGQHGGSSAAEIETQIAKYALS